jgi:GNAT superfamily N-acetyltransferase
MNQPTVERDATLAAADALAADLLSQLQPMRFVEAVNEREREEAFRLRYRAIAELGLASLQEYPDGLDCDELDADAMQILGWDGDTAVATLRIVQRSDGRALPVESAFSLDLGSVASVVEWGRLVVDPNYRGDGHSVLLGLAARAWLSMRSLGYTTAVGATSKQIISLLEGIGFAITVLGPARMYLGAERYPILCEARTSVTRLERHVRANSEAGNQ